MNRLRNCGKFSPLRFAGDKHATRLQSHGIGFAPLNNYVQINYMSIIRKKMHNFLQGRHISACVFSYLISVLFLTSCKNNIKEEHLSSPPEYGLNMPNVVRLPGILDEISGIAYYPKDKSVFAISDERGWLFKIFLSGNMNIEKWKFAKKEDFEDLVLVDSTFYILQSTGQLLGLRFYTPDSINVQTYKFPIPGKNEFEILYLDKEKRQLILLCKKCEADDKNSLSAWAFDLQSRKFLPKPAYIIDIRKVEAIMDEKKVRFKPSAAALHPITGRLFIISAINKVLVVADKTGNPEKVYKINPKLYKQPEGMTFTPEGHLLISNESKDIGAANIFTFKYNKGQ